VKGTRNIEIELIWANAEEAALMQPLIATAIQTIHAISTTPLQLACDGQERLRMKHMDLSAQMQQVQLQIEQLKVQQQRLLSAPKNDDDDEPPGRQRFNGNGAAKQSRNSN